MVRAVGLEVGLGRKKRRRAVFVSEADQRLLELGLEPSWEQKVSDTDRELLSDATATPRGADYPAESSQSNDQRLLENVPPHSHARS